MAPVILLGFLGLCWFLAYYPASMAGARFVGPPVPSATGYVFVITNASDRPVSYTVSEPQLKRHSVWGKCWFSRPSALTLAPVQVLQPGQTSTGLVAAPRHITARAEDSGATAWRLAVEYQYFPQPGTLESWKNYALLWVNGAARPPKVHTNYSGEVLMD
ncbi:MAG: hypothetical protein AB1705_07190 [Verrucomicrobiota bacterium]